MVLHYRWSAGNSIATLAEVKYKPTGEYNAEMQEEVRLHLRVCACPGVVQILAVALEADELTPEPCVVMDSI